MQMQPIYIPAGGGTGTGSVGATGPQGTPGSANVSNPNILINSYGKNPINQRVYVPGTNVSYGAYGYDRWKQSNGSGTVALGVAVGLRAAITSGTGGFLLGQIVENGAQYAGKAMTVSARVRATKEGKITIFDGAAHNTVLTFPASGSFETVSGTITISSMSALHVYTGFVNPASVTNDYFEFEWIKLEEGSVATPYVIPDPQVELARCQRYYYQTDVSKINLTEFHAKANGTSNIGMSAPMYPVPMRVIPTVTLFFSGDNTVRRQSNGEVIPIYPPHSITFNSNRGFGGYSTNSTPYIVGEDIGFNIKADAEL